MNNISWIDPCICSITSAILKEGRDILFNLYKNIKGILSCWENFWYVKTDSLVIPNHFWIFPNSTSNPPKFPKNYFFLVRNSTQMALTAPLFPLNWCQRLQNQNQKSVNDSKIWIKLVSMTPKSGSNWRQRLQNLDQISVNSKFRKYLEPLTPIWYRFWSRWP